jgi:hypothetical protein
LWCIDLASGNGTFVNDHQVVADEVLLGQKVELGDVTIEFHRLSRFAASVGVPAVAAAPADEIAGKSAVPNYSEDVNIAEETPPDSQILSADGEPELRAAISVALADLASERELLHRQWQSMSQEMRQQLEAIQSQSAALDAQRTALGTIVQQILSERSQLSEELHTHARQLRALAQEIAELRDHSPRGANGTAAMKSYPRLEEPATVVAEAAIEDAEFEPATEAKSNNSNFDLDASWERIRGKGPVARTTSAPSDDLQHFVSDRLVELDTSKRMRLIIYWVAGLGAACALLGLVWMFKDQIRALAGY